MTDALSALRAGPALVQMVEALTECQSALAAIIDPENRNFRTSTMSAWAQCVAAETRARTALASLKATP